MVSSAWIGILIEVFVADVLVVVGLAGQKLVVMRAEVAEAEAIDNGLTTPSPILSSAASTATATAVVPISATSSAVSHSVLDTTATEDAEVQLLPPPRRQRRVRGRRRGAVRRRCGSMLGRILLNWRWILAIGIFILGQSIELVALGFASQTEVVAMGNFGLPWNAVISVLVFKEEFSVFPRHRGWKFFWQWDLFAMATLILGATMVVIFAPVSPKDSDFDADKLLAMWVEFPYAGFGIAALVLGVACGLSAWRHWERENDVGNWNCVMLAAICSLLSSFTVTMSKVTTILIKLSAAGNNQYDRAGPVLLTVTWVAMLVVSMCLINISLGRYEQGLFFPIYEVLSSTLTIISGILYYKTYDNFENLDIIGFIFGVLIMVLGIWLTSAREHKGAKELKRNLVKQINTFERLLSHANAGTGIVVGGSSSTRVHAAAAPLDDDPDALATPLLATVTVAAATIEPESSEALAPQRPPLPLLLSETRPTEINSTAAVDICDTDD